MIIDIFCFIIFLFSVYQLSKDDFLFLRRGITLDHVFNTVFLSVPVAFLTSRLTYIFLHPSRGYFNPLVFLAVPYFPGLSLLGAIVGTWLFVSWYAKYAKIPQGRLLDILGISFLFALSIGILLQGFIILLPHRLLGLEEIGRGMVSIACAIFLYLQLQKGTWAQGTLSLLSILFYCLLSFMSVGFMVLSHKSVVGGSLILTTILFLLTCFFFILKIGFPSKLLKK